MRVFLKIMSKKLPFCAQLQKNLSTEKKCIKDVSFLGEEASKNCEYFFREKNSRKASIFCGNLKSSEDFGRELFKFVVIKKRVKQSFSRFKKARNKKLISQPNFA